VIQDLHFESKILPEVEKAFKGQRSFFLFRSPGEEFPIHYATEDHTEADSIVADWNGKEYFFGKSASLGFKTKSHPELPQGTSYEVYERGFEEIQAALKKSTIEKAILSRIIRSRLPERFDPVSFVFLLSEKYPQAFVYLLLHPTEGLWAGASPETLLSVRKGLGYTEALAGTQAAGDKLHWKSKEREEQAMVSHFICARLEKLGIEYTAEGPFTSQAGPVAHLKTGFRFKTGKIRDLISVLHPTPAIAGLPRDKALEVIHKAENHQRRLYCGFLGTFPDEQNCKLFVNLRCLQIQNHEAALYVGGGITRDSDLTAEWKETEVKAQTLLSAIETVSL
jgi:isochorismate synthase